MLAYATPRDILGCVEEVISDPSIYTKKTQDIYSYV